MTAFIITKDNVEDDKSGVGVMGPWHASDRDKARLQSGEGIKFRLLDDDGNIYYYGRRLETSDADEAYGGETELAPLDCWGTPNAGAVTQQEKNADGKWESIN